MKNFISILGLIIFVGFIFTSCAKEKEEVEPLLPVIVFNQQPGFVTRDTTAGYGDTLKFGIILQGNGKDNLIKFELKANDIVMLDSTINTQNFNFSFYTIKGSNPKDVWSFSTTDAAGNKKEESITITGSFGPIISYTAILMGAQNNAATHSFLSLWDNKATLFMQADAFLNQSKIDMFCYIESSQVSKNKVSMASPGGNIAGIFAGTTAPENYSIKNLTQFVKTTYTVADFDNADVDALLIYGFNSGQPSEKASELAKHDVYAFRIQSGLTGMFKVLEVNGDEDGTLKIDIKIKKELPVGKKTLKFILFNLSHLE